MTDVKLKVRTFIIQSLLMGVDPGDLRDDSSFLERSLIDSTGVLELVAYLEDTFALSVADEEMTPENLDSLDAVERYVRSKQGARHDAA